MLKVKVKAVTDYNSMVYHTYMYVLFNSKIYDCQHGIPSQAKYSFKAKATELQNKR